MGSTINNSEYWKNLKPLFNGTASILFRTNILRKTTEGTIQENWVGVWQNQDQDSYDVVKYLKKTDLHSQATQYQHNSVTKGVDLNNALRLCLEHENLLNYKGNVQIVDLLQSEEGCPHFSQYAIQKGITLSDLNALQQEQDQRVDHLSNMLKEALEKHYIDLMKKQYGHSLQTDNSQLGLALGGLLGAVAGIGAAYGYNIITTKNKSDKKRVANIYRKENRKKLLEQYKSDWHKYEYGDDFYKELKKEIHRRYKNNYKNMK